MSEQPSNRTTADWLVELCVYAPIGFVLDAHKYVPEFVERGRNQVALARFLGKFAVDRLEKQFGPLGTGLRAASPTGVPCSPHAASSPAPDPSADTPEPSGPTAAGATTGTGETTSTSGAAATSRPADTNGAATSSGAAGASGSGEATPPPERPAPKRGPRKAPRSGATPEAPRAAPTRAPGKGAPSETAAGEYTARKSTARKSTAGKTATSPRAAAAPPALPAEGELAIAGYATLAASQIVPRLTTLDRADLDAIGRFERANRARRTILNRVDQLLAER